MHRRVFAAVTVVVCGLVLAGCGSEDTGGTVAEGPSTSDGATSAAKKVEVKAANFAFDPTTIELVTGEDVQFVITNGDQVKHNITVEGLDVDQDVEGGKTAEADVTLAPQAGEYAYRCEYHPDQMKGTVTVG